MVQVCTPFVLCVPTEHSAHPKLDFTIGVIIRCGYDVIRSIAVVMIVQ